MAEKKINIPSNPRAAQPARIQRKFVVRLDPALHRQLAIEATRKGVSLNERVREKLASV
jgi:predicted HicB family RNase H-like nuclease